MSTPEQPGSNTDPSLARCLKAGLTRLTDLYFYEEIVSIAGEQAGNHWLLEQAAKAKASGSQSLSRGVSGEYGLSRKRHALTPPHAMRCAKRPASESAKTPTDGAPSPAQAIPTPTPAASAANSTQPSPAIGDTKPGPAKGWAIPELPRRGSQSGPAGSTGTPSSSGGSGGAGGAGGAPSSSSSGSMAPPRSIERLLGPGTPNLRRSDSCVRKMGLLFTDAAHTLFKD